MLREQVNESARRIDAIDQGGTRGVAVVGVQVAEVIKDVADVRTELRADVADMRRALAAHEAKHEKEARQRVNGRRWALGFAIAAGTTLAAILSVVIETAATIH